METEFEIIEDNQIENFKNEIIQNLEKYKKKLDDILFVTTDGKKYKSFDEFLELINERNHICSKCLCKLKIIGKDWYLEKHSYEKTEFWVYKTIPLDNF